jgi:hypothetical protein
MTDRRLRLIQGSDAFAEEIIGLLDDTTIRVHFSDDAPPWRRQTLGIALVDLLGRLFPRIATTGADGAPADPLLPPGPATLAGRLEEARSHGIGPQTPGEPVVVVAVGGGDANADVFCDADGWQSYLGPVTSRLLGPRDDTVPVGAVAAACRAAASVFAIVLEPYLGAPRTALDPIYSSALTYGFSADPLEATELPPPRVLQGALVGAGSVGGAAAYVWALVPELEGELDVVDYQCLESHNPDRALLATQQAAAAQLPKVDLVADALARHTEVEVTPHPVPLAEWVRLRPRAQGLPLMLCAFDSLEARRELQDSLPLEVINAACGEDRVVISAHRTGDGPCLYCLHVGDVLDTEHITFKLIVEATGLPPGTVQGLLEHHVRLAPAHTEQIEDNRGLERGKLAQFVGGELIDLYEAALRYGEATVNRDGDRAAVAAAFVTALAGTLLAGEALKAGDTAYRPYRLGPFEPGRTRYEEEVLGSVANALVTPVMRWQGTECLCRSARRQRLLRDRYSV